MCQDPFHDHDRAVHNDTEVDSPQAHQVGRHTEYTHHNKTEQHRQRNNGSHDQPGADIPQKDNQHEEDDQGTFYQVPYNRRDIAVYQLRAVQVRLHADTFGKHLLYLIDTRFQLFRHQIGIGAFQHHGDTAHTFALAVFRHGTKTLRCSETDCSDIADMDRDASPVGYHDTFDIFCIADHPFGTDIIGPVHFFDIATACILVVAVEGGIHITDSNIQRIQSVRVDRHFILLQITAETIDLYNPRNTGKLPFNDPVLDSTQLHRIVFIFITRSHFQYILVDLPQPGGYRHQLRRSQLWRDFTGHGLYLFVDQLPGIQCRYALLEYDRYERQPETGYGAYLFYIHNIAHGNFYGKSNQLFYFLRGKGRRNSHDLHLVIGYVRYRIDRKRQHCINSTDQQKQRRKPDEQLFVDRKMYNCFKHHFVI